LLLKRCQLSPATSGFCPDSQNGCSDGAKIGKVSETSKLFANFLFLWFDPYILYHLDNVLFRLACKYTNYFRNFQIYYSHSCYFGQAAEPSLLISFNFFLLISFKNYAKKVTKKFGGFGIFFVTLYRQS
jgi:hypothetical protein